MKIKTILFQGKYCIKSTFLDTTLQAEAVLEEGETMEEAMNALRDRVNKLAGSYSIHNIDTGIGDPNSQVAPAPYATLPEKNLQHEQIEIDIDNAQTREDLFALRERVPSSLVNHYMNRLKQLTK